MVIPCSFSLCRLLQAPANNRLFPALSLSIFSKMSDPLSRCSLRCAFSFLPPEHRPSPHGEGSVNNNVPYSNFSMGNDFETAGILLYSNLFVCSPPWLLALYVLHKRPVTFTSEQYAVRYLAALRIC
jgi:hypothetical protein